MKKLFGVVVLALSAGLCLSTNADNEKNEAGAQPTKGAAPQAAEVQRPRIEALLTRLKDGDPYVRAAAAKALGELGDAQAVEPLVACLKDKSEKVQTSAAKALETLQYKPATTEARIIFLLIKGDWSQLAQEGFAAVEPLVACLKDERELVRWNAARALTALQYTPATPEAHIAFLVAKWNWDHLTDKGPAAVTPLLACLEDDNEQMRQGVADALGKLGDARAVDPLITRLKDEDGDVRLSAAVALDKLGDARAVEPLIACLKDKDRMVRDRAVEALGKLADARAVDPLIACLKEDEGVRGSAAEALGKLGDTRAVVPLIAALKDEDKSVRSDAVSALGKLGDARAVEPLIACLSDVNGPLVRAQAAVALGELGDARAAEPLIACVRDKDQYVREAAAGALTRLGDAAVEPVAAWLKGGDPGVAEAPESLRHPELWRFVERDTVLAYLAYADLNGDGTTDCVLLLERNGSVPGPWVRVLILVRDTSGALAPAKRNDKIACQAPFVDHFTGIDAGLKTFTLCCAGGGHVPYPTREYRFNCSNDDRTWRLAAVVTVWHPEEDHGAQGRLLQAPPEDFGKIDFADFDPKNYLGQGER